MVYNPSSAYVLKNPADRWNLFALTLLIAIK